MIKVFIIGFFTLFAGFAISQNVKYYRNNIEKFYLEYPYDWEIKNFQDYTVLISEPAKKELTIMSTFDIQIDYKTKDIKTFCNKYEDNLKNNAVFKNFKIITKDEINFKNFKAIEYHCTANAEGLPLEWRSIIFQKDNKIFKLTTTSLIGQFFLLKEKTEKIFESFKFE